MSAISGILKAPFDILGDKLRGYVGLVDGLARRCRAELGADARVVATGGLVVRANPQLLPDSVRDRFGQTGTEGQMIGEGVEDQLDKSSAERLNLWRGGLNMIRQHPVLGTGLKSFARLAPIYTPNPIEEGERGTRTTPTS